MFSENNISRLIPRLRYYRAIEILIEQYPFKKVTNIGICFHCEKNTEDKDIKKTKNIHMLFVL